ncbi:MAG: hypothetical protein D3906_05840 [Candidatus Electrothrix sp. AUS1_2]|nr:hypothetical protein [Candidatus Electrothrix sp. AUS1_2]
MKRKNKNKISQFVLNFCENISSEKPILVPLRPVVSEPINECFIVVPEHISSNGGKQKIGWCIHVWRKVLIEAEFHCVWESPKGELIDISPKIYNIDSIIFLPDSAKNYSGLQVDNIRKPLANDSSVLLFIRLMGEHYRDVNKGDLANQYGKIQVDDAFIEKYKGMGELQANITRKYGQDRGISIGGRFIKYHMKS